LQVLITILHIVVAIVMILVVLLQAGKGANMGAAFGGSSNTVFGSSGPGTFLGKMTTVVAVIFMLTSLSLSYMVGRTGKTSMMDAVKRPAAERQIPAAALPPSPAAPQAPGAPAGTPAQAPAAR